MFQAVWVLFALGLLVYAGGALIGLAGFLGHARRPWLSSVICLLAVLGTCAELAAALGALIGRVTVFSTSTSGIPFMTFALRLDALGAFFLLILSLLGMAVAVYSFGYLRHGAASRNPGAFGGLLHLLLLSLTLTFTASDAILFLFAWEGMAIAAYSLVVTDHESAESRKGGLMYLLMSRGGTGMIILGFLFLWTATGSLSFADWSRAGERTSPVAVVLLFLGFGVKAGIIPLHVWLPEAHPVAPSNVSALMSGIVIKAGIYGMARVFFDFYGDVPVWMGMVVLTTGVVSALLGVLYALMEHDLKRLLAFHSIENIGIILIGFGSALLFRSYGHPNLAAMALVAGLFHTLNHGLFKGLLFLGAGSVLHATGTRNMEQLGGLIRRMPRTALFFLIGAIAISGLPPLNGFVSEWFTYQSLLAGFGATTSIARVAFPIAGSLLALTAALAAACFVKAFGITFLALPRGEAAARATEVSRWMQAGMAMLALACIGLGLGATWFLPVFDPITQQTLGLPAAGSLLSADGLSLAAGAARAGTVSPAVLALSMLGLGAVPLVLWFVWGRFRLVTVGPTWDCGLPGLTAENEYTATAFSKPLRMIFAALFRPRREIQAEFTVSPYYPTAIHFESEIESTFETRFYGPLREGILKTASRLRMIQAGSLHAYLAYIFVTLIILLLVEVR